MTHFADSHSCLLRRAGSRAAGVCAFGLAVFLVAGSALAGPDGDQRGTSKKVTPVRDPGRPGSFEIFAGGEWLMPQTLGPSAATMVANNTSSSPYTYFTTSGSRTSAPALRVGVGYNITRMFTVEGRMVVAKGDVQTTVSGDVESATTPPVTSALTQYIFDAALLVHLPDLAFAGGAGVPYLEGGAGYLRQVHEGNAFIESGQVVHFGGGVRYMLSTRRSRALSGIGIRADARVYLPHNAYSFDGNQHRWVSVGGGVLFMF